MDMSKEEIRAEVHSKGRMDAFSDGVLAIAITLLVLEIRLPANHENGLLAMLAAEWPSYFAYLTSFLTIGIMWINHDSLFQMIARIDRGVLLLNVLLLMVITFLNFPTVILAEYIQTPNIQVAALFYSGTTFMIAVCYSAVWWYARFHPWLFSRTLTPAVIRALTRQYTTGLVLYAVAFVIGFFSGAVSIALCFGLAVFFALPLRGANILPSSENTLETT